MNDPVLLMDVGGTNTRIRIIDEHHELVTDARILADWSRPIKGKSALLEFLSAVLADNGLHGTLRRAVVCCAGTVSSDTASLTNWPGTPVVRRADLAAAGLPADAIIMANDMEAAAHCVIAHKLGRLELEVNTLFDGAGPRHREVASSVLLIPGTGTGLAAIVEDGLARPRGALVPVSCEMQHTPIPWLDAEQGRLLKLMAGAGTARPSWEDFISGAGLVRIHALLQGGQPDPAAAAAIAERAVSGADGVCEAALDIYYRCAGALAQVAALAFQACGGIFLAGDSTRKNLEFIRASGFLRTLHDNRVRGELLQSFPVFLVASDLNLVGAACMARYYRQAAAPAVA